MAKITVGDLEVVGSGTFIIGQNDREATLEFDGTKLSFRVDPSAPAVSHLEFTNDDLTILLKPLAATQVVQISTAIEDGDEAFKLDLNIRGSGNPGDHVSALVVVYTLTRN